MNIYKTDSLHRSIILNDGRKQILHTKPENKFDLKNYDTFRENGEFVSCENLERYDFEFCRTLTRIRPIQRIEDFLEYQFEHTPDKQEFLKHINGVAIIQSTFREREKGETPSVWLKYLIDWIERKKKQSEQTTKEETPNSLLVKIKWDGQKNQLYDVIRQLKEREKKILNSYTDLAVFLKTNFEMFDKTSLTTIQTELQRGKRPPKSRRINLDTETQPE